MNLPEIEFACKSGCVFFAGLGCAVQISDKEAYVIRVVIRSVETRMLMYINEFFRSENVVEKGRLKVPMLHY